MPWPRVLSRRSASSSRRRNAGDQGEVLRSPSTIRAAAPATLVSITEFDRYQGKGVPEGRTSLSLRLTFRVPDRTLTDEEVEAATDTIVQALRSAHGAERR